MSVSSCGADSGRTTVAGWRSNVSTTDRALGADGELADVGDDGLVPEVHAVVGADRDHGPLAGPRRDVEIGDHLHGLRRYSRRRPRAHARAATVVRRARRPAWPGRRGTARTRRAACRRRVDAPPTARRRRRAPAAPGRWRRAPRSPRRRRRPAMPRTRVERRQQLDDVGRRGLVDRERADGGAAQVAQVGAAAEQVPEVGGQRADVRAARARRRRSPARVGSAVAATSKLSTVTGRGARSTSMPSRASSCRRRPSTWMRRHHRRHLLDVADEVVGDDPAGVVDGDAGHVVGGDDRAVGVERVGLDAEHDLADVALVAVADEAHQPGDRADADDEHAGGARDRACRRGRCGARRGGGAACRRRRGW